jgi:hypothetical protein
MNRSSRRFLNHSDVSILAGSEKSTLIDSARKKSAESEDL